MKATKYFLFLLAIAVFAACQQQPTQLNPGGYTGTNKTNDTFIRNGLKPGEEVSESEHSAEQNQTGNSLTEVPRPQKIVDAMRERGEQDSAAPVLKILEPAANSTVGNSTVLVKLALSGDLKGYQPLKPLNGTGNHIHVILDNQPYEAYYNLNQYFELRNVADGEHTLRVFPSRPWHESYKNAGAFQMVKFTVKNGGNNANATTTNAGNAPANSNTNANPSVTPEGKEMANSTAGAVDLSKPLLTYSRPKGEYSGDFADPIMIDFWLSNAKLVGDGGEYRVKYSVDGGAPKYIDKWSPIWLSGFNDGKHTVKAELVDKSDNLVENGGYNSTTREITVAK